MEYELLWFGFLGVQQHGAPVSVGAENTGGDQTRA